MRRLVAFLLLVIVVLFGLSFALLNRESVVVSYYLGETSMPLSLALVLSLVLGALLGVLATFGVVLRQRRDLGRQRRRLAQCEHELDELRKLPLKDSA